MRLLRICCALSTTQLLPLIHILRDQHAPNIETILLWHVELMADAESAATLMRAVMQSYPFTATYRLSGFRSGSTIEKNAILRSFEFMRNNWHDAHKLKKLLAPRLGSKPQIEIWTDEPIHFPTAFLYAMFPNAIHVKVPHAFNLESPSSYEQRDNMVTRRRSTTTFLKRCIWILTRLITGIDYNENTALFFDRAYTFDAPSCWSTHSVGMSHTLTACRLLEMFDRLPESLKNDVNARLAAASSGQEKPWVLLLLFGLDENRKILYRKAIGRILKERPDLFKDRHLVLKPHPLTFHALPRELAAELSKDLSCPVGLFDCPLNMDILWHKIQADVVLAGPCGAIPILKRLRLGQIYVIRELWDEILQLFPAERKAHTDSLAGAEII